MRHGHPESRAGAALPPLPAVFAGLQTLAVPQTPDRWNGRVGPAIGRWSMSITQAQP
jgi:hypothetical protein